MRKAFGIPEERSVTHQDLGNALRSANTSYKPKSLREKSKVDAKARSEEGRAFLLLTYKNFVYLLSDAN
jgi:hypothetical protein